MLWFFSRSKLISLFSKPLRYPHLLFPTQSRHWVPPIPPYIERLSNRSCEDRCDINFCRESFVCAVKFLFVPWSLCLGREVFVCAVRVYVCAVKFLFVPWKFMFVPWSFCLCRESLCCPRPISPRLRYSFWLSCPAFWWATHKNRQLRRLRTAKKCTKM